MVRCNTISLHSTLMSCLCLIWFRAWILLFYTTWQHHHSWHLEQDLSVTFGKDNKIFAESLRPRGNINVEKLVASGKELGLLCRAAGMGGSWAGSVEKPKGRRRWRALKAEADLERAKPPRNCAGWPASGWLRCRTTAPSSYPADQPMQVHTLIWQAQRLP